MVFLVDLANFIYRCSATYHKVFEINGVSYNVAPIYAFKRFFSSRISDYYGLVLEGTPIISNITNIKYKSNRGHELSETLRLSITDIVSVAFAVASAKGKDLKCYYHYGQEADQVVSSIVHLAAGDYDTSKDVFYEVPYDRKLRWLESFDTSTLTSNFDGQDVVLESTDSDFNQLFTYPNFYMMSPQDGIVHTRTNKAVSFVEPHQVVLYKSLFGDKSDVVRGCSFKDLTKQQLLDKVKKVTPEESDDIVHHLMTSSHEISQLIRQNCLKQFLNNVSVVELRYFGKPMQVNSSSSVVAHGYEVMERFCVK